MDTKENCLVCKFWISIYDDVEMSPEQDHEYDELKIIELKGHGMCRRYPPVWVAHEEDQGFYLFNGDATDHFEYPHTNPHDWCGEFVQK